MGTLTEAGPKHPAPDFRQIRYLKRWISLYIPSSSCSSERVPVLDTLTPFGRRPSGTNTNSSLWPYVLSLAPKSNVNPMFFSDTATESAIASGMPNTYEKSWKIKKKKKKKKKKNKQKKGEIKLHFLLSKTSSQTPN